MPLNSLDELRAFVAVAESASFTKAAQRLGLTTNAVSLRLQRLEAALGVKLVIRTTRRVAVTDEGARFQARVTQLLGDLDLAADELRPLKNEIRGTVRIAVPAALATGPLMTQLGMLTQRHPRLRIQTRVSNSLVSPAAEGLDIAVVVGQLPDSGFVGRFLGRVTWVLAAAPSYLDRNGRPRRPADLEKHQCLLLLANPPQSEWTLLDRHGKERSVRVRGAFEADDSRALGDATYAGLGIGVRPLQECLRAEQEGRLERVLPSHRFRTLDIHALLPQGRGQLPHVALCLEALRAAARELA